MTSIIFNRIKIGCYPIPCRDLRSFLQILHKRPKIQPVGEIAKNRNHYRDRTRDQAEGR